MRGLKQPPSSEITTAEQYANRREFLKRAGLFTVTAAGVGGGLVALSSRGSADPPPEPPPIPSVVAEGGGPNPWTAIQKSSFDTDEPRTPYGDITTYNNYYELGLSKESPSKNTSAMKLRPWAISIEGLVEKEMTVDVDTLVGWFGLEERVYRMRCVEAWSMVIPWVGFPLASLIKRVNPSSAAKYVEMKTLLDTGQLPGQREEVLPWPYVEGLRMDEAMNPLALLAVGIYGAPLLGQNGAPIRLVVPWKYGFKGVKSIVSIRFTEERPRNTWYAVSPSEYGFYANVNPKVDHPRWSQATERRIGKLERVPTLMFNGYAEHVAHLYRDMDLTLNF